MIDLSWLHIQFLIFFSTISRGMFSEVPEASVWPCYYYCMLSFVGRLSIVEKYPYVQVTGEIPRDKCF